MIYQPCTVIAELCCNHGGDINVAEEMIKCAKLCGADYIKLQKRNPIKAVPKHMHNQPHPCPMHSFGETYLEHRKNLEFSLKQHKKLKKLCDNIGIKYSCSVWDEDSAKEIISLNPDHIKIPSAMNENYTLLDFLFKNYNKKIHISLGMITKKDKKNLFKYLENKKNRTVVYATTSNYPVEFKELYLLEIKNLIKTFPEVGFSGHNFGIAIDLLAYCLQANWIERHFTLNRTDRGSDQSASLEPTGLQKLCRDLKAAHQALQYKNIDLTEGEKKNKEKLKIIKEIN